MSFLSYILFSTFGFIGNAMAFCVNNLVRIILAHYGECVCTLRSLSLSILVSDVKIEA